MPWRCPQPSWGIWCCSGHCINCAVQVGNQDMLNCYYAHADEDDGLQVRHLCAAADCVLLEEQSHSWCGGGHHFRPLWHGCMFAIALVSTKWALCLLVVGPAPVSREPARRHRTALGLVVTWYQQSQHVQKHSVSWCMCRCCSGAATGCCTPPRRGTLFLCTTCTQLRGSRQGAATAVALGRTFLTQ